MVFLKTLIINNYLNPNKIEELIAAVNLYCEYKVIGYEEIDSEFKLQKEFKSIILSGSESRIVRKEDVLHYMKLQNLILNIDLPTLEICFGHQLGCLFFGAKVGELKKPINSFEQIRIITKNILFSDFEVGDKIFLAENHFDYVKKDSLKAAKLKLLADSTSCEVEAVIHKDKPFMGTQFHPERIIIGMQKHEEGLNIIKNFLKY